MFEPATRLPTTYPRMTPPFRKGRPAWGLPFITNTISTQNPRNVPRIAPIAGIFTAPISGNEYKAASR